MPNPADRENQDLEMALSMSDARMPTYTQKSEFDEGKDTEDEGVLIIEGPLIAIFHYISWTFQGSPPTQESVPLNLQLILM